jgi:hypothetical protein
VELQLKLADWMPLRGGCSLVLVALPKPLMAKVQV